MLRAAPLVSLVVAGGCFLYTDPILERPSLEIDPVSSAPVHRGDANVAFKAIGTDPQHKPIAFDWNVYACVDGTNASTCDPSPFYGPITENPATFTVPANLMFSGPPVQSLRILCGAHDAAGATTSSDQLLVVPVSDYPPTLAVRPDSRHGFVVDAPMSIYAKVGDPADGANLVTTQWQVLTPSGGATYTLVPIGTGPISCDTMSPPMSCQWGQTFTAASTGAWTIEVSASDPLGTTTTVDQAIMVSPDRPPCLEQVTPIVPPSGDALPITSPTLFVVDNVVDDLDPYPATPSDPVTGVAQFQWSIEQPGATSHVAIPGATSSQMSLDPSTYNPGDVVELRVEVYDRDRTPITCADGAPTCAIDATDPTCLQRQTWRVVMQ